MDEGQFNAIVRMGESHLWRAEVKEYQFLAVINVLEALGYLTEVDVAQIQDLGDEIYPKGDAEPTEAGPELEGVQLPFGLGGEDTEDKH